IAVFAHARTAGLGVAGHLFDAATTVEGAATPDAGRIDTKNAIAGFHGVGRPRGQIAATAATAAARCIALDVIAVHAAHEIVNGHIQGLAFEVPEREVQGTQRMDLLAPRRVEPGAIHVLPAALN